MTINEMALTHHSWVEEMGWHNKASPLEALALIASEVGEAVNECRGESPTEEFGEELADIILRTLDLAVSHGIDMERECLRKITKNQTNGKKPGRIK